MSAAKIVLYDFPGSICSRMARLAIAKKDVTYQSQIVDITTAAEQFEPWHAKLNPGAVVAAVNGSFRR